LSPTPPPRSRRVYLAIAGVVLVLGWSVRTYSATLPAPVGAYAPDTLWALMVFLLVAALIPRSSTAKTAAIALALAYGIECSQLYQAAWINEIRATRMGGLVLGRGFLWRDLACYAIGIAFGLLLSLWLERQIQQEAMRNG